MNFIDVSLIVIVLFSIWNGWKNGFILGTLHLIMTAAGLILSLFIYPYFAAFIQKYVPSAGLFTLPLSFFLALMIIRSILSFLANMLLSAIPEKVHRSEANHLMGTVPGVVNGVLWAAIVAVLLLLIPLSDQISAAAQNSKFSAKMGDQVQWISEKISPVFSDAINQTIQKSGTQESEKPVSLPFTRKDPKVREDLEAKMLELVNEERQKAGLKPLKPDPEMQVIAREHSADMFAKGYFAHETPAGETPFDRMKKANIRFLAAGENLALGQTLAICHRGLMNSPGHRANILSPLFNRVGIGVLSGGIYGLMITQDFRN